MFFVIIFFEVTLKKGGRLFTKNTRLCKIVKWRIGSDTCPVLEGENEVCKHGLKAPVNGGRNSDGPKVAKFLVG